MALVNPHPALKVSVPMNPMVDGWMGDAWFHNAAFRQQGMAYIYEQQATRKNDAKWMGTHFDDYDMFMQAGSAGGARPPPRGRQGGVLGQNPPHPRHHPVLGGPGGGKGGGPPPPQRPGGGWP